MFLADLTLVQVRLLVFGARWSRQSLWSHRQKHVLNQVTQKLQMQIGEEETSSMEVQGCTDPLFI